MRERLAANAGRTHWRGREIELYAALRVDAESGLAEVAAVDVAPPAAGLFIKGRVRPWQWSGNGANQALVGVNYGIEAFFVEQGKGRELERRAPAGMPEGVQVPMDMQVALGSGGTAVLKSFRWSPLGMRLELLPEPAGGKDGGQASAEVRGRRLQVTLANAGKAPVAVVLPADLRTLHLEWAAIGPEGGAALRATAPRNAELPLVAADVRLLPPGGQATAVIDLDRSEWFVHQKADGTPQPFGRKQYDYRGVRVVYAPPPAELCRGLAGADRIVRAPLASRVVGAHEVYVETTDTSRP